MSASADWPHPSGLVILHGMPCTGKSTLASFLADVIHAQVVSLDEVWSAARLHPATANQDQQRRVYRHGLSLVKSYLDCGDLVVLDCTSRTAWLREQARLTADGCGVSSVILSCTASHRALKRRLFDRGKLEPAHLGGHAGHLEWIEPTFEPLTQADAPIIHVATEHGYRLTAVAGTRTPGHRLVLLMGAALFAHGLGPIRHL